MKKVFLAASVIGILGLAGGSAFAGPRLAVGGGEGISGSAHDLSSLGVGQYFGDTAEKAGLDRVCVYCHTAHNTIKEDSTEAGNGTTAGAVDYLPLWNHVVTTQVYTTYSNGDDDPGEMIANEDYDAALAAMDPLYDVPEFIPGNHASTAELDAKQPGSASRLCLSCHDGTVATNAYGDTTLNGNSTGAADKNITEHAQYLIGGLGDLTNHHPIGFEYDYVQKRDDEIMPSTNTLIGSPYKISDLLWGGKMECTTCHDVHNSKNYGAEKFLWVSDTQSNLCFSCHDK